MWLTSDNVGIVFYLALFIVYSLVYIDSEQNALHFKVVHLSNQRVISSPVLVAANDIDRKHGQVQSTN